MVMQLPNGCKCSTPAVHPKDWNKSKANIEKDWYINYRFHDSNGKIKQVSERGMNMHKTWLKRMEATRDILDSIVFDLRNGYNPITNETIEPASPDYEIDPRTSICKALEQALARITVEPKTRQDIKNILPHVEKGALQAKCKDMPVSEVKRRHIIKIFDQLKIIKGAKWSANLFNHYRKYLSMLFTELVVLETIEANPIDKYFRKQKMIKKLRIILTPEEKKIVHEKLKPAKYMRFRIYLNCFYHSGARTTELFRMRIKDVNLQTQYFKVTIIKGKQQKEVLKPIKNIAVKYWQAAIEGGMPDDYVFGRGLKPGIVAARPDYITHLWYKVIKEGKKAVIIPTFNCLRHLHADEIAEILSLEKARKHMDHTTEITTRLYAVGQTKREDDDFKQINNEF